jgi:CHAT domain-containing protein
MFICIDSLAHDSDYIKLHRELVETFFCTPLYIVSSYTPTLTAPLRSTHPRSNEDHGSLVVSRLAIPGRRSLPGTTREVDKIRGMLSQHRFGWLNHQQATVGDVLNAMDKYSCIHLACHGIQHQDDPTQSAFALYDGRLTLEQVSRKSLKSAQFAFLSACQTAMGADDLPDEAIHLAAGMLAAGYQSVIATLWSVQDDLASQVAEDF